jgi:hypothetical protein
MNDDMPGVQNGVYTGIIQPEPKIGVVSKTGRKRRRKTEEPEVEGTLEVTEEETQEEEDTEIVLDEEEQA